MNVLVTAGNTKALIDRVRCITNIFTGRTGAAVALHAHQRGHDVTLLTSRPEAVAEVKGLRDDLSIRRWSLLPYDTFEDLQNRMQERITAAAPDVVIHSAAVSDYLPAGIFALAPGTRFDPAHARWEGRDGPPALVDRAAGKVKSDEPELWLRLVRAPKLIDRVRSDWAFRGLLVKFKLEVGCTDADLLEVAERSRRQSAADLMVANTLEYAARYAFLGPINGEYHRVSRSELPARLLDAVEEMAKGKGHG
jgi:phosphopantothenoylcysteine synthetase/decarboxylase